MLQEALEGDWMFAVGTLVQPESEDLLSCVAPIGTLGILRASKKEGDGRSNLILEGIQTIRFEEWVSPSVYPKARISVIERSGIAEEEKIMIQGLLIDAVEPHLERFPKEIAPQIIESFRQMDSITSLIDNISHHFVEESEQRQDLLSLEDDRQRVTRLMNILN